jgi:hypothetical protein
MKTNRSRAISCTDSFQIKEESRSSFLSRKLVLTHNQIQRLAFSDVRSYPRLQQLDVSFNRLQYVDMSIVNHLSNLKKLFVHANLLKTLTNNVTFASNFHFKLSSNPLECDCRLRWLRNTLNRLEYPIYHDEPKCEMPKALADKKIVTLRDEQFVCGPLISKPELTLLTATSGEIATLRCDVSRKASDLTSVCVRVWQTKVTSQERQIRIVQHIEHVLRELRPLSFRLIDSL